MKLTQEAINELRALSTEVRGGFTAGQRWMELAYRLHTSIRKRAMRSWFRNGKEDAMRCIYCNVITPNGEPEQHTDGCMAQPDLIHLWRSINGPFVPWRPI